MLKHLSVYNFVLIHDIHVDLSQHMSVFTGETGAGKSLLVGSLNALTGQRINSSVIGQQDDFARIEGVFSFDSNETAYVLLEEMGFDPSDDVIFTREINRDGKNTCKINFRTVNLSILKEVLSSAVDIHSQHDTQYLLNNKIHLDLLDAYIHQRNDVTDMKQYYQDYYYARKKLNDLLDKELNEDYIKELQNEVEHIDDFNPTEEDFELLQKKAKEYSSYEKLVETLNQSLSVLEEDPGVLSHYYQVIKMLHGLSEFDEIYKINTQLEENYYLLDDLRSQLVIYRDSLEYDEDDVNLIQERIFEYHKLIRRYGNTVHDIIVFKDESSQKIEAFQNRNESLDRLKEQVDSTHQLALQRASLLSSKRKKQAKKLEAEIIKELSDLMLPDAVFEVNFKEIELNSSGIDQVEFYISMNKGEPTQPLAKVASGGELSRFMLGIKTILNRVYGISTTLFDEIDSGVSGKVALKIGQKMHQISKELQVITVSHLAPVAACADQHFLIAKTSDNEKTISSIQKLNVEQRIKELALISTGNTNEASLQAASELFDLGQKQNG